MDMPVEHLVVTFFPILKEHENISFSFAIFSKKLLRIHGVTSYLFSADKKLLASLWHVYIMDKIQSHSLVLYNHLTLLAQTQDYGPICGMWILWTKIKLIRWFYVNPCLEPL